MKRVFVKFDKALDLIDEADVLLFRGSNWTSRVVQMAGYGEYSHVGLATWHNCKKRCNSTNTPLLEITEFREGKGGRTVNLINSYYEEIMNGNIDVYRVSQPIKKLSFDVLKDRLIEKNVIFYPKLVTLYLRHLTGLPYGWQRIWWIAKRKLSGIRWLYDHKDMHDDYSIIDHKKIYPVCSTAVAAAFSSVGYDLTPNRADEWMEPSDIARSALLNYLFTLTLDRTE